MCSCNKNKTGSARYTVTLPGGTKVSKPSESAAKTFAAKHPGAIVSKTANS